MQVFGNTCCLAGIFHGFSRSVRGQDSQVAQDPTVKNQVESATRTIV